MPLANSNGPRWSRQQTVASEKRLRGIAPIRAFLIALLTGRRSGAVPIADGRPKLGRRSDDD
jgi:hypothetical protein